jgi:hypothetical protein
MTDPSSKPRRFPIMKDKGKERIVLAKTLVYTQVFVKYKDDQPGDPVPYFGR